MFAYQFAGERGLLPAGIIGQRQQPNGQAAAGQVGFLDNIVHGVQHHRRMDLQK